MATKSDESLIDLLNNRLKYVPNAIEAALAELQRRAHVFSEEELSIITNDIAKRREELEKENWGWRDDLPIDLDNLELYPDKAISIFTIIFGPFTGSILLSINLKRAGRTDGIFPAVAFGFTYAIFISWLHSHYVKYLIAFVFLNALGAVVLKNLFWNKYIGKTTTYKSRPIWIPLLIIVLIIGLLLWIRYGL